MGSASRSDAAFAELTDPDDLRCCSGLRAVEQDQRVQVPVAAWKTFATRMPRSRLSRSISASASPSRVRGDDAVLDDVVGASQPTAGTRSCALSDQRPLARSSVACTDSAPERAISASSERASASPPRARFDLDDQQRWSVGVAGGPMPRRPRSPARP